MKSQRPPIPNLNSLIILFYEQPDHLAKFQEARSADMPPIYRSLLDHDAHMTVTVESHHGCPVDVRVLQVRDTQQDYSRKIVLTRRSDGAVVQFGIVRLHRQYLNDAVQADIEAEQTPLGRVLIKHDVLRHVELSRLWQVTTGPELSELFGLAAPTVTYGRTAIIHCDNVPAVELLEIVAPEATS